MHPPPSTDRLLRSILAEVLPADCEADLLAATFREVARQRRLREVRKRAGVVAALTVMLGLTALLWPRPPLPDPPADVASSGGPASVPGGVRVVASRPLPSSMVVETEAGSTPIIESETGYMSGLATADASYPPVLLTEEGLLSLLAGQPVALVKDQGTSRLVVLGSP